MKKLLISFILCVFSLSLYAQTTVTVGDVIITVPSTKVDSASIDSLANDLQIVKDGVGAIITGTKDLEGFKSWLFYFLALFSKAALPTTAALVTRAIRIYKGFQQLFKNTATLPIVFALGLILGAGLELYQSGFADFNFNDWASNSFLTVAGAVAFYEFIIKTFWGESPKRETV
jgi:hypothetical protein